MLPLCQRGPSGGGYFSSFPAHEFDNNSNVLQLMNNLTCYPLKTRAEKSFSLHVQVAQPSETRVVH